MNNENCKKPINLQTIMNNAIFDAVHDTYWNNEVIPDEAKLYCIMLYPRYEERTDDNAYYFSVVYLEGRPIGLASKTDMSVFTSLEQAKNLYKSAKESMETEDFYLDTDNPVFYEVKSNFEFVKMEA